ncbi:MAG: carboxymuconolactone decarboxylase family protein [Thermoleophilia bacterium]|mgnify:CR=1 FL=1
MSEQSTPTLWLDLRRALPEAYRALAGLSRAGALEPILRELVKVRASQINGCAHCTGEHMELALQAGEARARLDALPAWHESDLFTPAERAALALTDAMTRLPVDGAPPEEVVREAAEHHPGEGLAHLIVTITAINAWNRVALTTAMGRG